MKKIIKVILSILFVIGLIFSIFLLIEDYSNDASLFLILAIFAYIMHLFAWIAPKTFFNLCWKMSKFCSDVYDYETSYSKLEDVDIGILITSIIILILSFLV